MRSLVGLIPLYAVLTLEPELVNKFPSFKRRMEWFIENKADVVERNIASIRRRGKGDRLLLSLVSKERLEKILHRMLDETEFLSEHGVRSMSRFHHEHPYSMEVNGQTFKVGYTPGESDSALFGGNSNWRGPVWLCVNFLLVESLLRFYMFYGDSLQIECPTGSGESMHLGHVAQEIQHRLQHLFARNDDGRRAVNAGSDLLDFDPHWKDYLWFHEYFDGDSGRGLGASHQCGWTGLIAKVIHDTGLAFLLPFIANIDSELTAIQNQLPTPANPALADDDRIALFRRPILAPPETGQRRTAQYPAVVDEPVDREPQRLCLVAD